MTTTSSSTTSSSTSSTSTSSAPINFASVFLSNQSNATDIANALITYFNQPTPSEIVSPEVADYALSRLNIDVAVSVQNGFIMSQAPLINDSNPVVGAIFLSQSTGQTIEQENHANGINSNISVGGSYNFQSFTGIDYLRMLLIDSPTAYQNVTDTQNRTLASSVVIANIQTNATQFTSDLNISLYFRVKSDFVSQPIGNIDLYCSFYDTNTKSWNDSGCSRPIYNAVWDRHECNCNHLTSFALIWLPKTSDNGTLSAQDIASLVFQSVSICCFLIVIVHVVYTRIFNPDMSLRAKDCLSLISSASTTFLFIFYIALGMTVYTSPETKNTQVCFLSASVLMFLVYFFLIFMFCIKTSIAYFTYINFVHLFPAPSFRKLYITIISSFVISITYVAFAAGFNSNSSFGITQLYVQKICWFTQRVIHYFVTIPICTCLLLNIIMLIFVVKRLIEHVRNSTTTHRTHQRLTRSVLVLIASCVTQGIGWLFGPFLTFVDENTANILGWFFVVFNGLEGFWTVILYIIIRKMRVDDRIRRVPAEQITSETTIETRESRNERRRRREAASVTRPDPIEPRETLYERRRRREAGEVARPDRTDRRNASRTSHSFNDLHTMGEEL